MVWGQRCWERPASQAAMPFHFPPRFGWTLHTQGNTQREAHPEPPP